MKHIWNCRRTLVGLVAIVCLTALGFYHVMDVAMAIAGVVASIAGSNAYQKSQEKKYEQNITNNGIEYDMEDK